MFAHGRSKGPVGRMQAKIRGEVFNEDTDGTFDMSDVLEGIDLTRSFIRGGLTHTGLFALGLLAGGLNLSGEDDETKKRRAAARFQGAGFVYDPRKVENDFRNSDAMFIDWLPFGLGHHTDMVQLNWMLKQFFSPVM